MADCECLTTCPFFNDHMENMPKSAEMLKISYCRGDNMKCARYMVFKALGKGNVPSNLYPQQRDRVELVIAEGKKN